MLIFMIQGNANDDASFAIEIQRDHSGVEVIGETCYIFISWVIWTSLK